MTTYWLNILRAPAAMLLLLGTATVAAQDLGATPITWVNGTSVSVNGNTVTEACNGCGNAAAESQQALTSSDGYVEFVVGSGVLGVGVGSGPPPTSMESIEFGLYFNGNGSVEVREMGRYVTDTTYTPGDRFRIAVQGGVVSYHKYDGARLTVNYNSQNNAALQYPVKVEAILLGVQSSVSQAVVRAGTISQPAATPSLDTDITWINTSNAVADGNTLTATAINSGAQSNETLNGDGYIEFTAVETDKMRAVGLDNHNADNTFHDIDFAIVLRQARPGSSAVAEVWETGSYISDTPYSAGDRFRIAVENGVVKYYKYVNGERVAMRGRNAKVGVFPLRVDAALYDPQSTIADVTGRRMN